MRIYNVFVLVIFSIVCLYNSSCRQVPQPPKKVTQKNIDSFYSTLYKADSIYALKNHLNRFATSMRYYDTAVILAEWLDIDSLKLLAYDGIARAYDAWNQIPEKTVYYYERISELTHRLDTFRAPYADALLAFSYMKNYDSAKAVKTCVMVDSLEMKYVEPGAQDQFYTLLAYICVSRRSYLKAYEFSKRVKKPELITNEGLTFKTYQTITQTSLHLYYLHTDMPQWIDSVMQMITKSDNLSDSLSNYNYLIESYVYLQQKDSVLKYEALMKKLNDRFGNSLDKSNAKNSFLEYEIKESEKQKTLAEAEKKELIKTTIAVSLILILLLVVTTIIFINRKKIKQKNKALALLNKQLDDKATQNELLVKEMHHRVKNNLTLIYSLLEMQGRKTNNEETQEQLLAARQRIESIAITHEQLYANKDGEINMKEYISTLVQHILYGQFGNTSITTSINIEENIVLSTNTCLPLAMLVNEWLTNTMKYAISENNEIVANITAYQINNTITLIYFDTGDPIKNNNIKVGLGSKIISLLCKQINATLDTNHNNKALNYKISFNL